MPQIPQVQPMQQPQAAPPVRQSKRIAIIDPESGVDVLADMERERKQPPGPKVSHAIVISSPTGEPTPATALVSSPVDSAAADAEPAVAQVAEEGSEAAEHEPATEASVSVDSPQEEKSEVDGEPSQRRESTSVDLLNSNLVSTFILFQVIRFLAPISESKARSIS